MLLLASGDWLVNLPSTRAWFNSKLEHVLFPLLHHLFPEIIRTPSILRAHSVSLLKYNHTHPRTDVHIDNGILAMTLAMTPQSAYRGGGTFYEHMGVDHVLPMDVGHGTFRPGSVRHGGHRVTSGTRYILGAFLLLEDHVEHVRRLKNRGSELRTSGDLQGAINHFEWALALNPRCTTCLKDWAEVLLTQKEFAKAEVLIRKALEMLEGLDSDALFTLGLILSEQGKDDESISTYMKSIKLNAEDAELCYNLGIKLGEKGDVKGELSMYKKATEIDPHMGGAWINMGTTLAESGDLDSAELMFLKAIQCCDDVKAKGMMNLALTLQTKANNLAAGGDLNGAKAAIDRAAELVDEATPLLHAKVALGTASSDDSVFAKQTKPLRVQIHRLCGQILAGMGDLVACEAEFRTAADKFGEIPGIWEALARVLDLQGKTEDAKEAREKLAQLRGL
jgi:tetratricopeptide (TPR) repeat protein